MISPNIINNVGSSTIWTMTVVNGPTVNTNVSVALNIPSDFQIQSTNTVNGTVSGLTWNIGTMNPNITAKLIVVLTLAVTPSSFTEHYTFTATVSGLDTVLTNNVLTDYVDYQLITPQPLGGANPDFSSCLCIDVSLNDTPCSQGITEWRLNESSIVNGILQSWDKFTGKGSFTPIDPTKPITFTYDLFCVQGSDEYEVSCDVEGTIYPQLSNLNVFNHTIEQINGTSLDAPTTAVLTAQYPTLDLSLYTWNVLYNANGEPTSGVPLPIYQEVSGYLCDADGKVVFVWNNNGEITFKYTDGTDFIGDPTLLTDCCCNKNTIEDEVIDCQYFTGSGVDPI